MNNEEKVEKKPKGFQKGHKYYKPNKKLNNDTHLHMRIETKLLEEFKKVCYTQDKKYAKVVRSLIVEYIKEYYKEHPEEVEEVSKNN